MKAVSADSLRGPANWLSYRTVRKVGNRFNELKSQKDKGNGTMSRIMNLNKPLAIVDLETTGTSPALDRIVEIAILKVFPDGKKVPYLKRINPGIPIPPEATAVHGIADKHVKECPQFKEVAVKIDQFLKECDLAGYNLIRFDLPMLQSEFARVDVAFSSDQRHIIDPCQIFHRKEPRDLAAALRFFCDEEHSQAHSAMSDVRACWKVLEAQVSPYTDLPADLQGLHDFCNERDDRFVDADRKFEWRYNEATFAFGKHRGHSLKDIAKKESSFLDWMLRSDFRPETKMIVERALRGKFPTR
jgi:DNA polymerase III subunit epsilon